MFSNELVAPHPFFAELAKKQPRLESYLELDDFLLMGFISKWASRSDGLGELCKRLRQRRIFKTFVYSDESGMRAIYEKIERIRERAKHKGFDPNLFVILDDPTDIALKSPSYYKSKKKEHKYQPLYFVDDSGTTTELATSDSFVNDLNFRERRIHVPEDLLNDVKDAWKSS